MKLEGNSTPVQRSQSLRSQPYDLRRRVLVNNFLRDQPPVKRPFRPPTPRIPYELQSRRWENTTESSGDPEEDSSADDDDNILNVSLSPMAADTKTSEDILYLLSRRLRSTETSKLRQPCRKSRRPTILRRKEMLSESQEQLFTASPGISRKKGLFKSGKLKTTSKFKKRLKVTETMEPIRSYPTFEKLNEICVCDSSTYNKTLSALRIKSTSKVKNPELPNNTKKKQSTSIRRSLSKILKLRSSSTQNLSPPPNETPQMEKRQSFVAKLFSPFTNPKLTQNSISDSTPKPASISRSMSLRSTPTTPGAPKLRRRANSVRIRCVRLSNDAF